MAIINHMFVLLAAVILFVLYVSDVHGDGYSSTYRKQDDNGHYSFGYKIKDKKGSTNFRKEKGDGWGQVTGSYGLHDKDGRMRVVHYKADKRGFRAVIKTNEPGTSNDDSANAIYNGVDDSWGAKSHVESGSKGGWSHQKKHEDHWGHKEDHWGNEKKPKEPHGWEDKHPNHW